MSTGKTKKAEAVEARASLVMMTDGTRVQVRHIVSYRPRENGEIHFLLNHVRGPEGIINCKTTEARDALVAQLDELFGVLL